MADEINFNSELAQYLRVSSGSQWTSESLLTLLMARLTSEARIAGDRVLCGNNPLLSSAFFGATEVRKCDLPILLRQAMIIPTYDIVILGAPRKMSKKSKIKYVMDKRLADIMGLKNRTGVYDDLYRQFVEYLANTQIMWEDRFILKDLELASFFGMRSISHAQLNGCLHKVIDRIPSLRSKRKLEF